MGEEEGGGFALRVTETSCKCINTLFAYTGYYDWMKFWLAEDVGTVNGEEQ